MTNPRHLEAGDNVKFDMIGIKDTVFKVHDVEVSDVGITETVAVILEAKGNRYSLVGTTADSSFTLSPIADESGSEWSPFPHQIEKL